MKLIMTGASGFVGRHLIRKLVAVGHEVRTLGRRPVDSFPLFRWDSATVPPSDAVDSCDAVIHLAGETVAQRWTADAKQRIRASRVEGTRHLVEAIANAGSKPGVLLAASAVGIYGSRGDELLTENSSRGSGFLADVVDEWESAARRAEQFGTRVVNLRFGVILGSDGGAFPKMAKPFRLGAGGRLGSGDQWMPWVHIEDAANLILFALETAALRGPVNVTAPNPVTNATFTGVLAAVLHRPALLSVPAFALKIALGEMAGAVLASERVLPSVAVKANFQFRYPQLDAALRDLAGH